jgi:hypothetical protein
MDAGRRCQISGSTHLTYVEAGKHRMLTHRKIDPRVLVEGYVPETWQRVRKMATEQNMRHSDGNLTGAVAVHTNGTRTSTAASQELTAQILLRPNDKEHTQLALHTRRTLVLAPDCESDHDNVGSVAVASMNLVTGPLAPQLNDPQFSLPTSGNEQETPEEQMLTKRIVELWSAQKEKASAVRKSREDLLRLRASLGRQLFEFKSYLVRTGRNGGWMPFLRTHGIPRSTADRYIERHKLAVEVQTKRPSEAFSCPTEEDVMKMVKELAPKLSRFLVTSAAISQFFKELETALYIDD